MCHWEKIGSGGGSLVAENGNGPIFDTKARLFVLSSALYTS